MTKSEKLFRYTQYLIERKKKDNEYPTIEMIENFSEWLDEHLTVNEKELVGMEKKRTSFKKVG